MGMFKNIDHVIVMTSDMNRSVEFYESIMGFELKMRSESWTEFNMGSTSLALHSGAEPNTERNKTEPHSNVGGFGSISFNVENVDEVYEMLQPKGVNFTLKPEVRENENLKLAIAQDPDGFEICFAQHL